MSYIFKALQQAELENAGSSGPADRAEPSPDLIQIVADEHLWLENVAVVKLAAHADSRMVTITDRHSLGAEKFRLLRARLRHLQDRSELKKIVITSGVPGEGKTTVAANLAISLSRYTSQRVLLLDGDLRSPAVAGKFGLQNLRGISEWFESQDPLIHFIYRVEGFQLWLLPAGNPAEDPLRILQSARFSEAMNRLTGCFDWIVIDTTPLVPLADVHVWAGQADGILLVVREGKTAKKLLLKGLSGLDGAKVLGVVFNDAPSTTRDYYQKYYRGESAANASQEERNKQPGMSS